MKKFLFLIMTLFAWNVSFADKLGPNVDTVMYYGAPGVTMAGNETQVSGVLGVKKAWAPVDFVGEAIVRENSSLGLMASKQFGDKALLGGVAMVDGADGLGLVFGVDVKRVMVRVTTYETKGSCSRKRCSGNDNHSALTVGYKFKF